MVDEKKKPVRVFKTGDRCRAIHSEECLMHDNEDISGNPDLEPPLHDECDCQAMTIGDTGDCVFCGIQTGGVGTSGIGVQATKKTGDETTVTKKMICFTCLVMIAGMVNQLMQSGQWAGICKMVQGLQEDKSKIIVPQKKKIISPFN